MFNILYKVNLFIITWCNIYHLKHMENKTGTNYKKAVGLAEVWEN